MLANLRTGRLRVHGTSGARLPERPAFWAGFVLMGEP
jgi:CHAT domain-containing protein